MSAGRFPTQDTALLDDVRNLLDDVDAALGGDAVAPIRTRLDDAFRIAVAGRTNAGKSTLVNALIGHRVAPTAATECTRATTWMRYGPHQTQAVCADGATVPITLTDAGRLPDELPVPAEQVNRIDVWVDYAPLRELTLIDTPGLSTDEHLTELIEQLLAGGEADALLFVLGETCREDEVRALTDYRASTRWLYDGPVNAIGLLSRADRLSGPDGPWAAARAKATAHTRELSGQLAGVLPVVGKLGETATTGSFSQQHADWLSAIAALPDEVRQRMLRHRRGFETSDVLPAAARRELLDRLDMYGVTSLAEPQFRTASAPAMLEALYQLSGLAAVQRRIEVMFTRRSAVHKAHRALTQVERLLSATPPPAAVRDHILDRVEVLRDGSAMHGLAELRALAMLYSGRAGFDAEVTARALRLFEDADLGGGSAPEAVRQWRAIANTRADLSATYVAETAATTAHLLGSAAR